MFGLQTDRLRSKIAVQNLLRLCQTVVMMKAIVKIQAITTTHLMIQIPPRQAMLPIMVRLLLRGAPQRQLPLKIGGQIENQTQPQRTVDKALQDPVAAIKTRNPAPVTVLMILLPSHPKIPEATIVQRQVGLILVHPTPLAPLKMPAVGRQPRVVIGSSKGIPITRLHRIHKVTTF